jgi:hypothetical protein
MVSKNTCDGTNITELRDEVGTASTTYFDELRPLTPSNYFDVIPAPPYCTYGMAPINIYILCILTLIIKLSKPNSISRSLS